MPSPAPQTFNATCRRATTAYRTTKGSSFASASILAMSSLRTTIFLATASTSQRGWRASLRPGGVAVSGIVRDQIGNRLDLAFVDKGEQALKIIERPVRVYVISFGAVHGDTSRSAQSEPGK